MDHLASALIRWHGFQQRFLSIEHPDAGWTQHLVSGEDEEITIQLAYIHGSMRKRLSAVDKYRDVLCVSRVDHGLHRIDGSQRVTGMDDRHQSNLRPE